MMHPKSNLSIPVGQQADKVMYPQTQKDCQWQHPLWLRGLALCSALFVGKTAFTPHSLASHLKSPWLNSLLFHPTSGLLMKCTVLKNLIGLLYLS